MHCENVMRSDIVGGYGYADSKGKIGECMNRRWPADGVVSVAE